MSKRQSISKKLRFSIFARDGFACRYCGRQGGDVAGVELVIDHIIPVVQGGTNIPENLLTSCQPCNAGKGGQTPTAAAIRPEDTERLQAMLDYQRQSIEIIRQSAEARAAVRQQLVNLWGGIRGTKSVGYDTIRSMLYWYEQDGGIYDLQRWIEIAQERKPHWPDWQLCKYIGGIRKREIEKAERDADAMIERRRAQRAAEIDGDREATTDDR